MVEKLKDRYNIITIFIVLTIFFIIVQLFNLQIIQGKELDDQSQRRLLKEREIVAPRGNILDRNGVPIASNRMSFIVELTKTDIKVNELNAMLLKLTKTLEKNNDTYNSTFYKYLNFNPIEFGKSLNNQKLINKWIKDIVISKKDIPELVDAKSVFTYLRDKKFKINKDFSDEDAYKIMSLRYEMLIKGYTTLNPLCIAKDITKDSVVEIEERYLEFPGVSIDTEPIRKYMDGPTTSHLVGYVAGISAKELEKLKDVGYNLNDTIGKTGIELQQEEFLKGKPGEKKVEFDTQGKQTKELIGTSAIPGNDVILTIDSRLQKAALSSLESNIAAIKKDADFKKNFGDAFAGSVIAMDVNTGEILAMVSSPSYDPSVYMANTDDKESQKIKNDLLTDSNAPMLNRATQGIYVPGSTYKPITAIAALEENIITPSTQIYDSGRENIGGWEFFCLEYRLGYGAHGNLSLERALATSCNIYFHIVGSRIGVDGLDKWSKIFGLGELTGIDLPGEKKGIRANKETKKKLRKDDWRPADTAQTAIGQFDNAFTPIQLINYISTIANGGKKLVPHVVKKIIKYNGDLITEAKTKFETIPLKQENIVAVKKGMVAVTNAVDGTAAQTFKEFPFSVAGKTGTPETGEVNHSSNALFVCYAPAENPEIAVAVVIERGVWGANAAPVARDVLREYFSINNRTSNEDKVESDEIMFNK